MIVASLLLILAIISLSLFLTPLPLNRISAVKLPQFMLFLWIGFVGLFMTLPYLLNLKLPLQQGLGDNSDIFLRGLLYFFVSVFCIIITSLELRGALSWIKGGVLVLIGASQFFWVLDFMNTSVNGVLNGSDMSMKTLYSTIYPYIMLLLTYIFSVIAGGILLVTNVYRFLKEI